MTIPDEPAVIGAFVTVHILGMILGLGAAAIADLLGLGLLFTKLRVPRRLFSWLHNGIFAALALLLVSGGGLIAFRMGGWCELDGANIARFGPVCMPVKLIAKLVLMAILIGNALLIDKYLLPLSRLTARPLLPRLSIHRVIRAGVIGSASFTCWVSLAAIPLVKALHSWTVFELLRLSGLMWIALATVASSAFLLLRARASFETGPVVAVSPGTADRDSNPRPFRPLFATSPPAAPSSTAAAAGQRQPEPAPVTLDKAFAACRRAVGGIAGISLVINVLMLAGPIYMLQVYDRVLTSRNLETLTVLTVALVGLYVFMGALEVIRARILARIALRLDRLLGAQLMTGHIGSSTHGAGDAGQQPLRDLEQIRLFASGPAPVAMLDLPWTPLYLALIFLLHPLLGLVAVAGTAVLVALSVLNQMTTRRPLARAAEDVARTHALVDAGRRNAETLRAMAMVGVHRDRWLGEHRAALSRQLQASDIVGGFAIAIKVGRLLLQSLILGTGAYLSVHDAMSPGAMIAASIIAARALAPIEQLIAQWRSIMTTIAAVNRCRANLAGADEDKAGFALPDPHGHLQVCKLFVSAPGRAEPVLKGIDFRLEPGDALAVIGASASGKSALARALVGVWPAKHGEVRLDGAALDQWDPRHLGKHVGYLPQDVTLLAGSIAQNIGRLEPSPDARAVLKAAAAAGVHEMILRLENGYATEIGDGQSALSGGQKQRIALARALYGSPALIVLDEPNANLDGAGEAALAAAIKRMRAARSTVIVMAHRQSILGACNRLLVLDNGRQVAFGDTRSILQKVRAHNDTEPKHVNVASGNRGRGTT